ncbi:MAG: hypothetical protein RDU24_02620 [Humidesulfovibrio sp.]|nr:hypothetical protein [Humidesulfovibrio sp.]
MHIEPARTVELTTTSGDALTLRHCANIHLNADEFITFTTPSGTEYDVTRKAWGYYATPSLNGRLPRHGLRGALVENSRQQHFIHLVEIGNEEEHRRYLESDGQRIVVWLDETEKLTALLPDRTES